MNKQSERFYEILKSIKELHDKKRHDYGADEDIFANFRLSELAGVPAWQGAVIRMGDKYARLANFIQKGEFKFKEENIKDTLMDMAIYSLITMILFEEAEEKSEYTPVNSKSKIDGPGGKEQGHLKFDPPDDDWLRI